MKILIIEDEVDIANVYRNVLRKEGFDVIMAEDGRTGIALALQHKPALILLDLLLPQVDGITVLRELRAKGSDSKVIILTASPILRLNEGVELGIHAYLNKGISTPREIVEIIKATVGKK